MLLGDYQVKYDGAFFNNRIDILLEILGQLGVGHNVGILSNSNDENQEYDSIEIVMKDINKLSQDRIEKELDWDCLGKSKEDAENLKKELIDFVEKLKEYQNSDFVKYLGYYLIKIF